MAEDGSRISESMLEVVERILGDGAFIFTDPLEEADRPDPGQWKAIGIGLEFSGYRRGRVSLWAEEDFARLSAANMLGIDEASARLNNTGCDALKEILNMVVGNLLTTIYGPEVTFDLAIPRTLEPSALQSQCECNTAVWLEAEGRPLLFTIDVDERQ